MKFIETLKALSLTRQLMLAAAVASVVLGLFLMVRMAGSEKMVLLYSGLDAANAGEVVAELEQRGVTYELRGETIFIAEGARDSVRLSLARDGLPNQSVQGYELLDDVNGFSVTSEMYSAAYWRAKEGELTRTILAIPGVRAARVHIGAKLKSGFERSGPKQTASVTLQLSRQLTADQAEAIQYLVALAVSGLNPSDVVVVDVERGVVAGPDGASDQKFAEVPVDDQAALLESKIVRLLEARVGQGNARASVSMQVSRERELISSVTFDPDSRVLRSRTVSDSSESREGSGAGAITVASNLPEGDGAQARDSTSNSSRSSETVAYDVSETRTETERLPGTIERVSVAVMLDTFALGIDPAVPDADTRIRELSKDFEALVISGAGLDLARGDSITVEIMPFQKPIADDLVAAPSLMQRLMERHLWSAIQFAILALMVVVLALGVLRPMLSASKQQDDGATEALPDTNEPAGQPDTPSEPPVPADPIELLRSYAVEREDDAAALLSDWLNDERKAAVNE